MLEWGCMGGPARLHAQGWPLSAPVQVGTLEQPSMETRESLTACGALPSVHKGGNTRWGLAWESPRSL